MASLPTLSSRFTMKFHGFSETFKAVLFKPKGGRRGKDKDSSSQTPPSTSSSSPPSPEAAKLYLGEQFLSARLLPDHTDFDALVRLPPGVDCNEWLATHTVSFFNHINQMYGVIAECCTPQSCPTMAGPDNVNYQCYDDKGKKIKLSAPQHVDHVMSSVQTLVTDETVFPAKYGQTFPADFKDTVRNKVHRHLLHVLAHIYHCHYSLLVTLGLHGHLNSLFSHFMAFGTHFHLLPDKDAEGLMDVYKALRKNAAAPPASHEPGAAPFPGSDHQQILHLHPGDESGSTNPTATTTTTTTGDPKSDSNLDPTSSHQTLGHSEDGVHAAHFGCRGGGGDIKSGSAFNSDH